ncbi:Protease HtpX [Bremerella volcania]|uniref:Protease HtpX n=1 Tax=Bremerella volcania TaxID=2527984 RepID=A0A518C4E4_9BACT|nr:M48 family metalloprotease [Bremerella volcania]QDU74074.1 Protease HtpX [Bremerella volcania]
MADFFTSSPIANAPWNWGSFLWFSLLIPVAAVVAYPLLAEALFSLSKLSRLQKRKLQRALPCIDDQLAEKLRVWATGGRVCNAAVMGCVPGFSFVLVSDALLSRLSPRYAAAIVAHEIGHLRLWHVPIRLSIVFAGGILGMTLVHLGEQLSQWQMLTQSIVIVGTIAYMTLMLHFVAPLLEFQADAFAVNLLSKSDHSRRRSARVLIRALSQLTLLSGMEPNQSTWLYPSFEQRRRVILSLHSTTRLHAYLRWFLAAVFLSQITLIICCLLLLIG